MSGKQEQTNNKTEQPTQNLEQEVLQLAMKEVGIDPETGGLKDTTKTEMEKDKKENTKTEEIQDPQQDQQKDSQQDPQQDPQHKRLTWLTRQDKILREREKKIAELEASVKSSAEEQKKALEFIQEFKKDPFGVVERELGPDAYKTWTKQILADGDSIEDKRYRKLELQNEQLRQEIDSIKNKKDDDGNAENEEEQEAVQAYFDKISETAKSGAYEMIKAVPGAIEEAKEYARLYAEKYGEVLTPEQACAGVNDYLEQQHAAMSKVRGEEQKQKDEPTSQSQKEAADNDLSSEPSAAKSEAVLTEEQREQRALQALDEAWAHQGS